MSARLPFDFTDYYTKEMGRPLFRHFITFERLVPWIRSRTSKRPRITWKAGWLPRRQSPGQHRPGIPLPGHMILATTKSYTHRPYLRGGIYADLTLIYRGKSFQPLSGPILITDRKT